MHNSVLVFIYLFGSKIFEDKLGEAQTIRSPNLKADKHINPFSSFIALGGAIAEDEDFKGATDRKLNNIIYFLIVKAENCWTEEIFQEIQGPRLMVIL